MGTRGAGGAAASSSGGGGGGSVSFLTVVLNARFDGSLGTKISNDLARLLRGACNLFPEQVGHILRSLRAKTIAPLLRVAIAACLIMSVMLLIEAVSMAAVSLAVKILRRRPEKRYRWEPIAGDEEEGSLAYPMVLVQIPMFNEKKVKP